MGMATFTENIEQVRTEFSSLAELHAEVGRDLAKVASKLNADWGVLSMGMSGDWKVAVEEGSTMVRVGSAIFGARNTPDSKA